ncbi:PolC-type DNA polymerase III [Marinisporobacter balticus]|uniref:DNA polymerase III PolC-type n=1 Tax=Marinisporobacter balticus TaxID=2018667 RepID=A0A4R2LKJ9_9FIRM|nr:PolC-type DNA polymerase III [Marinisporobacter balticus]TCO79905.1 DNA polymerase III catalytic subunit PolC type [Marinisporobacter balticus]
MAYLLSDVINSVAPNRNGKIDAMVEKIKYHKESKTLNFIIISSKIIRRSLLDDFKKDIKKNIPFVKEIKFIILYKNIELEPNNNLPVYWENIVYALNKAMPSTIAWLDHANFRLENETLIICIESDIGVENLKGKKVDHFIKEMVESEFDKNIKVLFEVGKISKSDQKEAYKKEKETQTQAILQGLLVNVDRTPQREIKQNNITGDVILGKKINELTTPIPNINEESGIVSIEGEIFDVEWRELKNGKSLCVLSVTDYKGSMAVKIFAKKEDVDGLTEVLKKEQYIKARGDARYDTFSREIVIMAKDMVKGQPKIRMDKAEKKRIELHAHTQMSSMDGVSSAASLVKRAAKWGHPAIAITDHGVVQAFPEAMDVAKKNGIKVIYGVEGYLVNDGEPIVIGNNTKGINQCYVVFDIETTGLSSKNDKITEIGAVKIRDNEIIDRFNVLVNPEMPIPPKIVELTGITDDMVKNQPSIEKILPKFLAFLEDVPVVAHNAGFDTAFIKENCNKIGLGFNNPIVDTLRLSKILLPNLKRFRLNIVAKELGIALNNHHRAVDDAEATANIFIQFLAMLKERGITQLNQLNDLYAKFVDVKKLDTFHVIILVKNYTGLKNLYKIISTSHMEHFYKKPRIPKSLLSQMRDGLIIGTACEAGELYRSILGNKSNQEIENIIKYYDYLEIQPIDNNQFLIEKGLVKGTEELKEINRQIVNLGKQYHKPVVATGDVHFLDPKDEVYRRILMAGQGFSDADNQAPLYLRTTNEMLEEFKYLGENTAMDVVINHPDAIAQMIDPIIPIPEDTYPPIIEGADEDLRNMCYEKATRIYGDPLPDIVKKRLDRELNSIISNGYAVMYIIAQKLVTKSLSDGYLVGSRGSVGSSFVATMSDITEVNPLPPHYICNTCKHSEFITDGSIGSGADLPDKKCPMCSHNYVKEGHDIPFEVFLGFEGDKEPDIDLNFAGEYQPNAHKYTEVLFGEGYVFRAGTIGTIADKTAYGFVKKYFEGKDQIINNREINRLTRGCTGVKRTTGQHPGGVMVVPNYKEIFDFTPIQYPANDGSSGIITTHFDYHSISGRLLKLDILGHDVPTIIRMLQDITGIDPVHIPLDDPQTVQIFTSPDPLKIIDENFQCEVGSLGIPEFGTKFVRQMLVDTQPTTFAELVRISGLSHGTDVWLNNGQDLVRQKIAPLKDVISTRDDIMNYLILKGLPPKASFKIMEKVRKGKGLIPEDEVMMHENNVPQWYIDSCNKIKYMFPKAHAVAYVMMSFRLAYFKVHHPLAFYATYFTTKASDFDAELVVKGKESIKNKIKEIEELGNHLTQKEKDLLTVLEVVYEMYCRGFECLPVDLYKSDSDKFIISNDKLLPPLRALQGVGENAARSICKSRKNREFISMEDIRERAKVTKTVIENLKNHGCLNGLPDTNQLSLF